MTQAEWTNLLCWRCYSVRVTARSRFGCSCSATCQKITDEEYKAIEADPLYLKRIALLEERKQLDSKIWELERSFDANGIAGVKGKYSR